MVFPQLLDECRTDAGSVPVADGAVCGGRGSGREMARGRGGRPFRLGGICVLLLSRWCWAVPHRIAPGALVNVLLVWTSPTAACRALAGPGAADRKSTRLNSSHRCISYA